MTSNITLNNKSSVIASRKKLMPPGRFIMSTKATQEQNQVILMSQLWGLPKCTMLRTERNKTAVNISRKEKVSDCNLEKELLLWSKFGAINGCCVSQPDSICRLKEKTKKTIWKSTKKNKKNSGTFAKRGKEWKPFSVQHARERSRFVLELCKLL